MSIWKTPYLPRKKTVYDGIEWVRTGDLAYIDSDGYIFLKGRTRRLIIDKLGYKISPDNCENYIQSFPSVRECVVVGVQIAGIVKKSVVGKHTKSMHGEICRRSGA